MGCGSSSETKPGTDENKACDAPAEAPADDAPVCDAPADDAPVDDAPATDAQPAASPSQKEEEESVGLPRSRVVALKAVSAFLANLEKDKSVEEDDVVEALMKECPEKQVEEVLDMVEDANGVYSKETLQEGVEKYEANLKDIVVQITDIKKQKEAKDSALTKLLAVSAFKEGAACKSANPVQKKSIKMRSLALVAELAVEIKVPDEDETAANDLKESMYNIAKSMYNIAKTVADEVLGEYLEAETEIRELVTSEDKKAELRALWKKCDNNGSKKLSTTEFNSFARTEFPLFVQPRANRMAFKLTCQGGDGDEWVERREFASLLKNMAFLNKMYFFFDEADSSDDGKITKEEFASCLGKLFPAMPADQADIISKGLIEKADKGGNGSLSFREFVPFVVEMEQGVCGLMDAMKPIADEEDI